jgi:hypothetical protein
MDEARRKMPVRFLHAASLAFSCLALSAAAPTRPRPSPWAALAERDLAAIHDIIRDNHPGPVDPENPHYRDWLEDGLVRAGTEAKAARSYSDYVRALRRYTNGFQDAHLVIDPFFVPRASDWTGFVVGAGPDGRAEVLAAEADSGVKVGDRIESCDGQSFDALMKARTDPYFWNSAIPQGRLNWVSEMFVANPDEHGSRLVGCRFSSGTVKLNWRAAPTEELNQKLLAAAGGGTDADQDFDLKEVGGIWFVRLPRFWFKSDDDQNKLNALVEALKAKAPELRRSVVVFDVRGNGGGNSLWGYRLAVALWGEDWANRIEASFDNSHDLRVSPANMRKVSEIVEAVKRQNDADALPYWNKVQGAMRAASAAGRKLAHIDMAPTPPSQRAPPNPVTGRVFLLTDPACGSACLDFADLVLHLPDTVQIGGPTFADAVYIDINELTLPSGLTNIRYGMKVMRHRVRANNQWYEPRYRWPGGPMTDAALAAWVRSLPRDPPRPAAARP